MLRRPGRGFVGRQYLAVKIDHDAIHQFRQCCSRAHAANHLVLVSGPSKVGAAVEARIEVSGKVLFHIFDTCEDVELDAAFLAAKPHRHEALLLFERSGRR
jgi:hypothetical protein